MVAAPCTDLLTADAGTPKFIGTDKRIEPPYAAGDFRDWRNHETRSVSDSVACPAACQIGPGEPPMNWWDDLKDALDDVPAWVVWVIGAVVMLVVLTVAASFLGVQTPLGILGEYLQRL